MRIEKCSASAINSYKFCNFQYYLEYVLGMQSSSGKSAVIGTIVHQVLEWTAKLRMRNKTLPTEWLIDQAWDMHTSQNAHLGLQKTNKRGKSADFIRVEDSVWTVLNDKRFSPLRSKIIQAEEKFNIEMPGSEWETQGRDGERKQFCVRGLFDVVRRVNRDTIEVIDYKTGKKKDWNTLDDYDLRSLMEAVQPRIYHFAASYLFPEYKNILLTFFYINDGGPVTISFSPEDLVNTIGMIWEFFRRVKNDGTLRRNQTWKCSKFCSFGRNKVCDAVYGDLMTQGQEFVEIKYRGMSLAEQEKITGHSV